MLCLAIQFPLPSLSLLRTVCHYLDFTYLVQRSALVVMAHEGTGVSSNREGQSRVLSIEP